MRSSRYLLEKANVGVVKNPDVGNTVALQRHAGGAHAERPAGVLLAVHARGFEHSRMNHPGTEDLGPAGALADGATSALAELALDVHLGGGFRKREIAGAEARARRAEERSEERRVGKECRHRGAPEQ